MMAYGNTEGDNQDYSDLFDFLLEIRIVFSTTADIGGNRSRNDSYI